jgi:hypothetical protein
MVPTAATAASLFSVLEELCKKQERNAYSEGILIDERQIEQAASVLNP